MAAITTVELHNSFNTSDGNIYKLIVERPDEDLTVEQISAQLNAIISSTCIKPDGSSLSAIDKVQKITKTVDTLVG